MKVIKHFDVIEPVKQEFNHFFNEKKMQLKYVLPTTKISWTVYKKNCFYY